MARDISFIQYMRAHGNTPGPTQRPLLTGALSGVVASLPYVLILNASDALRGIESKFSMSFWTVIAVAEILSILGGIIYAWIFKRAANDTRGGWLFGMSYGFLLWMLGPVALWQSVTSTPVVVGIAAMGMFGAKVLYGLILGFVFPHVHRLLRSELLDMPMESERKEEVPGRP